MQPVLAELFVPLCRLALLENHSLVGFQTEHAKQCSLVCRFTLLPHPSTFLFISGFSLTKLKHKLLLQQAPHLTDVECHLHNQLYFGSLNT